MQIVPVRAEHSIRSLTGHLKDVRHHADRVVGVPSIPLPTHLASRRLAASVAP
jgi:hypothetical protein